MDSLIPAPVSAAAAPNGKLAFGFGRRFLIALLLGLLWLIPAWADPRFAVAMAIWDVLVLIAWAIDLQRLPKPSQLETRREWVQPLSLGRPGSVKVELHNQSAVPISASLVDESSVELRDLPARIETVAAAGAASEDRYEVMPRRRGDLLMGRVFLRYRSALGLAERWAVAPVAQRVRVQPDLQQARNYALYLIRSRQVEMEKRRQRHRGMGREFESLREYRKGDELRDVCWPATARRHQLISRTYQAERSQHVWIVLDAGRLLRAQVNDAERGLQVSKLDYAVDAALAIAQVAAQSGDKVGLLAYGRSIQQSIGIGRGPHHLRALLNALALVNAEVHEADHTRAARTLLQMQTRRALVIWITDFAETATVPEVIDHAILMSRKHLVLFAAMTQPDLIALAESTPEDATKSADDMFRHAAAIEIAQRREALLRRLRDRGVLAMDLTPGKLADSLINRYLEVKDRSLL